MKKAKITYEELAADGTTAGVELENEFNSNEPFDPASISIEPKVVPMDHLLRRLRQGSIRLAPTFQRKFVWDIVKTSQLIESLMLRIPLPMFYVSASEDGNWDVVDGLQRLTTIRNFILGAEKKVVDAQEFALQKLEFWGDRYNGMTFSDIVRDPKNARIVNNIMETEMRFTVINPGTPEEVKRNIFKRINTGGMPLTSQEIRHALYQGASTKLLQYLVERDEFKIAVDSSINDSRMVGRELILRFLAFSIRQPDEYPGDMDKFLSDTMRMINGGPQLTPEKLKKIFREEKLPTVRNINVQELTAKFVLSMERSYEYFEKYAFRKAVTGQRRTPINKALFESWSNLFANMSDKDYGRLLKERKSLLRDYSELLERPDFERAISRDASSIIGVRERYKKLQLLIKQNLG